MIPLSAISLKTVWNQQLVLKAASGVQVRLGHMNHIEPMFHWAAFSIIQSKSSATELWSRSTLTSHDQILALLSVGELLCFCNKPPQICNVMHGHLYHLITVQYALEQKDSSATMLH